MSLNRYELKPTFVVTTGGMQKRWFITSLKSDTTKTLYGAIETVDNAQLIKPWKNMVFIICLSRIFVQNCRMSTNIIII